MTARVHSLDAYRRQRAGTEPWATKRELASHLGFSVRWVELRMAEGMPHERFGGQCRFQTSVCEQWLIERGAERSA